MDKPIDSQRLADLTFGVASWVDEPNHEKHPYNDLETEREQWGDVARTPAVRALMDAGLILEWLEKAIPTLVEYARADGETWQQIGETLGMTRQAAQQRFGR